MSSDKNRDGGRDNREHEQGSGLSPSYASLFKTGNENSSGSANQSHPFYFGGQQGDNKRNRTVAVAPSSASDYPEGGASSSHVESKLSGKYLDGLYCLLFKRAARANVARLKDSIIRSDLQVASATHALWALKIPQTWWEVVFSIEKPSSSLRILGAMRQALRQTYVFCFSTPQSSNLSRVSGGGQHTQESSRDHS